MSKKDRSRSDKRQLHKDDRGSTLVVVVVAMLLLCVLATIILYTTYVNYTIKTTELHSTDNFYTAESVMDEIKAGLELEVSNAYTNAYLYVMQHYSDPGDTDGSVGEVMRTADFQRVYINYLKNKFDPDGNENLDPEMLFAYLSEAHTLTDGEAVFAADGSRAKLELVSEDGKSLVAYSDSVWIKGLRLTYTDAKGYVAVITTDIALRMPNMTFEEQSSLPGVLAYSLIADEKLYIGEDEGGSLEGGTYTIKGSVYGGAQGILVRNSLASFEAAEAGGSYVVVTGGNIEVYGGQNPDGTHDAVFTANDASLWADGIIINSSELNLTGESHVQDDLTINGRNSSITLSGAYYGFGYQSVSTAVRTPEDSSSILVNGAGVALNFSGLTTLDLAGQAYIGTTDVDEDGVQDEGGLTAEDGTVFVRPDGTPYDRKDNTDVRMGESISVKSNQIAYLVPPECIGYIGDECVLGSNPVSLSRYQDYWAQRAVKGIPDNVPDVDLSKMEPGEDIAPMTLSDYGAGWQKVFYQAAGTGNNAWVYYYLTFDSASQANAFFADYYTRYQDEWINDYLKNYLSSYSVPASIEKLNLAGNAVYYDAEADKYILQPASATDEIGDVLALLSEYEGYSNNYKALNTNLTMNYAALTDEQIARASVFQNIVDVDELRGYMGADFKEVIAAGGQKAILIDNAADTVYVIPDDPTIKAVIATGDVRVSHNYKGMILSGGRIFVTGGSRIEPDPDAVSLALQADNGRLLNCFWEGRAIAGTPSATPTPGAEEPDVVAADELVVYRNWKKD
ncbi:MAG: hypothetical protein NC254_10255 [bacterium]|nr:hypothetical protein [bacterium]